MKGISGSRNANLPVVCVLFAVSALGFGLHLSQAYTGPLDIPQTTPSDGPDHFMTGTAAYPRRAIDAEGHTVTIMRPPRRIASLQWKVDEFLYSVVPPESVIAVSAAAYDRKYSNVYPWAEKLNPIVGANAEVVLKLEPDLVLVASQSNPDFTDILESAGIPVFRMFTMFTTLEEVRQAILLTGYLTGHDAEAQRVYEEFQRTVERARARKPVGMSAPRILGYGSGYSYGDHTLFHDIVRAIGGINVGAENGFHEYDSISTEQILRWDPEWIVSGANRGQSAEVLNRLLEDPAIGLTTAARRGQIVVLENNVFLPMSPFTALRVDALSEPIYSRMTRP